MKKKPLQIHHARLSGHFPRKSAGKALLPSSENQLGIVQNIEMSRLWNLCKIPLLHQIHIVGRSQSILWWMEILSEFLAKRSIHLVIVDFPAVPHVCSPKGITFGTEIMGFLVLNHEREHFLTSYHDNFASYLNLASWGALCEKLIHDNTSSCFKTRQRGGK